MSDILSEPVVLEEACCAQPAIRDRSLSEGLAANAPYAGMALLGALVFLTGLGWSAGAWAAGVAYVVACALGAVWVMAFICPWCVYHGTRGCPCGYGMLAAKLRARAPCRGFARQFRRHIPVIAPLWLAPAAFGVVWLARGAGPAMVWPLAAFAVVAFVVLPLTSRAHSCGTCPQRDECPWMGAQRDAGSQ